MFTPGWIGAWVLVDERNGSFYKEGGKSATYSTEETAIRFLEAKMFEQVNPSQVKPGDTIRVGTLNFTVVSVERKSGSYRFGLTRRGEPFPRVHNQPSNRKILRWVDGAEADPTPPKEEERIKNPKEAIMAKKKAVTEHRVNFSGRIWEDMGAPEIKGLDVEVKPRGRGTTCIANGSSTAMKRLAKALEEYGEGRKGRTGVEYEDRYTAHRVAQDILESVAA